MIEKITYKTKLEDLLDLNQLIEIINKYSLNFEKNYSINNPNNKSIKQEINKINNHIIELAKNQRRKELEKLLEKTTIRINELDETLYNINEGIKLLRSNPKDKDFELAGNLINKVGTKLENSAVKLSKYDKIVGFDLKRAVTNDLKLHANQAVNIAGSMFEKSDKNLLGVKLSKKGRFVAGGLALASGSKQATTKFNETTMGTQRDSHLPSPICIKSKY